MAYHDIVVVGASAGGVEALSQFVQELPSDLQAAVLVVLHVSPHGTSYLPSILSRAGALPATHPTDGQPVEKGNIYIAPPDHHMLVRDGHIALARGPRENGHRPAVDPLFRSAARAYGPRVIGIILSGTLDDGTAGLMAVKLRGGIAVVQDPESAAYPGMPRSALENVQVDHVVPLNHIASLVARYAVPNPGNIASTSLPAPPEPTISGDAELEANVLDDDKRGQPSVFACPECGGALWEINEGGLVRFRCRTGHAFSAQTLLAEQVESLEEALWVALRALEEQSELASRLAERALQHGHRHGRAHFLRQAQEAKERAAVIRRVLLHGKDSTVDLPGMAGKD
ncbi:MAG: chemotaxis protein CheB [Anaerolineae bacterium]|nr:chemotaxis protein CheB [Anaerolineae bacterium]